MAGKFQVFLSHSSNDAQGVAQISDYLEQQGFRCWRAPRDIDGGESWPPAILNAIEECRVLVVFISASANSSEVVEKEVLHAIESKKRVIPVRLNDVKPSGSLAFHLKTRQVISLLDDRQAGLEALSGTLQKVIRRRARKKPKPKSDSTAVAGLDQTTPAREIPRTFANPYEFDTPADSETFKGRQTELDELVDSIKIGSHTAIFGLQRMGKTSLVEQRLRSVIDYDPSLRKEVLLASVDFQRLGDDEVTYRDLMHAIVESMVEAASSKRLVRTDANLRLLTNQFFSGGGFQMSHAEIFDRFVTILKEFSKTLGKRIVLFIDEFSETRKVIERTKAVRQGGRKAPQDAYIDVRFMHHISGILKDPDVKEHFTLIVAVRPFMAEFDQKEDLQILKLMKPISLYHLSRDAAEQLITQPLSGNIEFETEAVERLCDDTAGHPYLLQFVLSKLVSVAMRTNARTVHADDVARVFDEMVSDAPAYEAHFDLLVSDYSVDEIRHEAEARLGRGMLAVIAKHSEAAHGSWVPTDTILHEFVARNVPPEKAYSLLDQLLRVRIIDELERDGELWFKIAIPLLRKRFVRQNLYYKYFRTSRPAGRR